MFSESSTTMRPRTTRTRSLPESIIALNLSTMSWNVLRRAWACFSRSRSSVEGLLAVGEGGAQGSFFGTRQIQPLHQLCVLGRELFELCVEGVPRFSDSESLACVAAS